VNYRHAFHAGNFADLLKHAALLILLQDLQRPGAPLTVLDTHAGRGLYDLAGEDARRSGEAEAGILRLMSSPDAPAAFAPLKAAVSALNGAGPVRRYPGSPWLIAERLRPGDRYLACELNPAEHAALKRALAGHKAVEPLCADGFAAAPQRAPAKGPALVLIDPPFEKPDDYRRSAQASGEILARNPAAVVAIWLPLKDLETFDAFLRELEAATDALALIAEARLRPLSDPMKMNGCAMVVLNPPPGLEAPLAEACAWLAATAGEGGLGKVWRL
jgi:23S rRNA (adenine2030-N6)-methyltransferase